MCCLTRLDVCGLVCIEQRGVAPADRWNWGEWGNKEYKWMGSFLGWFVGLAVPEQEILFCLGWSSQPSAKYFFPHRTQFRFLCPHRPASWAGSCAGSPVFKYVSPVQNIIEGLTLVLRGAGAGWQVEYRERDSGNMWRVDRKNGCSWRKVPERYP